VFLAGLYQAERVIADRLLRLLNGKLPWPWIDPDKALPWVEQRIGLQLAESQKTAIRLALVSKVLVITGGRGPRTSPGSWNCRRPIGRSSSRIDSPSRGSPREGS
jgi:hypothetical protein